MKFFLILLFSTVFTFQPEHVSAQPSMIRHGYRTCTACHESSNGGGLLTAYGKGIGNYSGSENENFQLGFQGRLLFTKRAQQNSDFFIMQADLQNKTVFQNRQDEQQDQQQDQPNARQIFILANGGLRPNRTGSFGGAGPRRIWDRMVLRQALLVWNDLSAQWRVQAGREILPMGIFSDDHTLYSRRRLRRGVDDYTTLVKFDLSKDFFDWGLYGFGPNFEERIPNREWGGGTRAEFSLSENKTIGILLQSSRSQIIGRHFLEVFSRLAFTERVGFLASGSFAKRAIYGKDRGKFTQILGYFSPFFTWNDWAELHLVAEWFRTSSPFKATGHQWGPSLKFRPLVTAFPYLGFQMDYRLEKNQSDRSSIISAQTIVRF